MPTILMTTDQVADLLNVKNSTIAQWRYSGKGPKPTRVSSRCVRYDQRDVELWLAEQNPQEPSVNRATSERIAKAERKLREAEAARARAEAVTLLREVALLLSKATGILEKMSPE